MVIFEDDVELLSPTHAIAEPEDTNIVQTTPHHLHDTSQLVVTPMPTKKIQHTVKDTTLPLDHTTQIHSEGNSIQ